jgi:hypothetical protein
MPIALSRPFFCDGKTKKKKKKKETDYKKCTHFQPSVYKKMVFGTTPV